MAIRTTGLDDLIGSFDKLMDIPDEVQEAMLNAEADVVAAAQKAKLEELGLHKTGQLKKSISRKGKIEKKGMRRYLDVYPQGIREDGTRNAEVGFILEYGAPKRGIPASGWMKNANEECSEEAVEAAADVYNKFLEQL